MPVTLVADSLASALPVWTAAKGDFAGLPEAARRWARTVRFEGEAGSVAIVPATDGGVAGALLGLGKRDEARRGGGAATARRSLLAGALAHKLPAGDWRFADGAGLDPALAGLALRLGGYRFDRYRKRRETPDPVDEVRFHLGGDPDVERIDGAADGVRLARDLINTPTSDMGPADLEAAVRRLASGFGAVVETVEGDALIEKNFPMIHAVGRASATAPRLVDLTWGSTSDPKVTLVGKGVCFDTGGLDIKPASGHAPDEEGHGWRGERPRPRPHDHGRRAEGPAAGADPGGGELHRRQRVSAGRRADEPQGAHGRGRQH